MHTLRLLHSTVRETLKRVTRSPKWRALEKAHLKAHPACLGCGSRKHVQVHHVKPFHLHPELELEPTNLVSACMDIEECHLRICHGDLFKAFNPNAVCDLQEYAVAAPTSRPHIWAQAKASRLLAEQ